ADHLIVAGPSPRPRGFSEVPNLGWPIAEHPQLRRWRADFFTRVAGGDVCLGGDRLTVQHTDRRRENDGTGDGPGNSYHRTSRVLFAPTVSVPVSVSPPGR